VAFADLFSISFGSQAQKAFTVDECIEYAFLHNPLIHVATKDSSIAELERMRAKGLYLPRLILFHAFSILFYQTTITGRRAGLSLAPLLFLKVNLWQSKRVIINSWFPTLSVNQLIFSPSLPCEFNITKHNIQLQGAANSEL
jgi:hypothetical protein